MEWSVGGAKLGGDLWTILHCLFRVDKGNMLKKQGKEQKIKEVSGENTAPEHIQGVDLLLLMGLP